MLTELNRLQAVTAERAAIQNHWVAALRAAVDAGATLEQAANASGLTRQRVSQIVGVTGRKPGRRPAAA